MNDCLHCKKPITSTRKNVKYCSTSCRSGYNMKLARAKQFKLDCIEANEKLLYIKRMIDIIENDPDL